MPYELHRRAHKTAQRLIEHEKESLTLTLKETAKAAASQSQPTTISNIDDMIKRMENLKRKLSALASEEEKLHRQSKARLAHVKELECIPTAADVKYDEWSKVRLNRLLVDYLLRSGYVETAIKLAKSQCIEDLVDVDAFVQCQKIEQSLKRGETKHALLWCADNKQSLKKMGSNLEYELRLQEYIELVRKKDRMQAARDYARRYLATNEDKDFTIRAAGLLSFGPTTLVEPFKNFYAPSRWPYLSRLFLKTYHDLLSLPQNPPLHIALSAGLSALKTPSCHSTHPSPSSALNANTIAASPQPDGNDKSNTGKEKNSSKPAAIGQSVCPICSTELNALARNVPYAHHSKSIVESDPVVLPNGRMYGRERLMAFQSKVKGVGVAGSVELAQEDWDEIIDPADPEFKCRAEELKKVYIS